MFYRENVHYQNMLPEQADVNLLRFSNASLAECSVQCLMGGANCQGVFHNKETRSCKLLYDNPVDGLVFQTRIAWNFFSVNRRYPFLPILITISYRVKLCYKRCTEFYFLWRHFTDRSFFVVIPNWHFISLTLKVIRIKNKKIDFYLRLNTWDLFYFVEKVIFY